jgi:hypothetical protein
MIAGSKIIASAGCGSLSKNELYYFLVNDRSTNRARLAWFDNEGLNVHLITLTSLDFETALEVGDIKEVGIADACPPWLGSITGANIMYLELQRVGPKETYDAKVNRRFLAISELLDQTPAILGSDKLEALINAHARNQSPVQNTKRLRLWFFSYLIFGQTKWSLMPKLKNIGLWDRSEKITKKLGRPSRKGAKSGFPITPAMKEQILTGFDRAKSVLKTRREIYGEAMRITFGCHEIALEESKFYHPRGEPFPSDNQFWNWVIKQTDPTFLSKALNGKSKARRLSGSVGKFSDLLSNLNQVVEFDGYNPPEKISGFIEETALNGFNVVRAVCGFSGLIVGIGFARGSEDMEAYRNALFCMAIGKARYCELFGITINPDQWPAYGMPMNIVFDRGPAASMSIKEADNWLAKLELTPTHDGQAKASVESSHPKKKKNKDQASYRHSKLNHIEIAQKHIYQLLMDNKTSNASARMSEEMWQHNFTPTPINIWKYWDERGRNRGIAISFEDAVRKHLTPHNATIRRDGVYLYGRRYNCKALTDTRIFDKVARQGSIKVVAHVLTMCVRHIWIDVEGTLHELSFMRPAGSGSDNSDISLFELKDIQQARTRSVARLKREHASLEQAEIRAFEKSTGKSWHSGTTKLGSPVKNEATRRDNADLTRVMGN